MDDVGRLWIGVVICVVAVAVMSFFAVCENAAVEIPDSRIKKLLSENDRRMKKLSRLLDKPSRLVAVNVISRTVMIILVTVIATFYFFEPLSDFALGLFDISGKNSFGYYAVCAVCFVIIGAVLAVIIAVFAVNVPKKLCVSGKVGENFILRFSGMYKLWLYIFLPMQKADELIARGILRLFGVRGTNKEEAVTEEEILMMVDAVNETGGIEESQAEMISNIFEFDDIEVRDVMTHRTEIVGIEENSDVREAVKLALDEGFSRIPVYEENVDNICGVVFAKDLLSLVLNNDGKAHAVKEFMREIRYVPESNKCGELFNEFTRQKTQIAVAVDEYGGTAGIITMEDLLESIVGNIQDEYDDEEEEIQEITPNTFDFLGKTSYKDAMEALGKDAEENSDYDTIGGFVIDLLGRIPDKDERPVVKWENINFTVISVTDNKIDKLRGAIQRQKPTEEEK